MLLVLTGVTAVSVALLAYVNELTTGPIAEANAKTVNEALKKSLFTHFFNGFSAGVNLLGKVIMN